jgi:prepilin-type N-terminal cleavage/methylation domain-containing protein
MRKNMKRATSFSLIELMIVVIIIGVLVGISLPAYQGYVLRSHRTDAHSYLLDIAARQERFVAQRNTYTTDIAADTGLNMGREQQGWLLHARCGRLWRWQHRQLLPHHRVGGRQPGQRYRL